MKISIKNSAVVAKLEDYGGNKMWLFRETKFCGEASNLRRKGTYSSNTRRTPPDEQIMFLGRGNFTWKIHLPEH